VTNGANHEINPSIEDTTRRPDQKVNESNSETNKGPESVAPSCTLHPRVASSLFMRWIAFLFLSIIFVIIHVSACLSVSLHPVHAGVYMGSNLLPLTRITSLDCIISYSLPYLLDQKMQSSPFLPPSLPPSLPAACLRKTVIKFTADAKARPPSLPPPLPRLLCTKRSNGDGKVGEG
jgi:hypothetical protein